ncbi:YcnI family copper-binding membrane protein [Paenibacillus sp. D9]|uniref:YcnI family copper-binding membrane protein n=1 Tax=Paenibacillus sp. D9 TaxID=665792 RepID=UPI002FC2DEA7
MMKAKSMKKLFPAAGAAILMMLLMSSIASAHVTVWPKATTQGSYEVFTVRVPSEKADVTTTAVKVRVPDGVEVSRTQPLPGWKTTLETTADGKIESITWTADEGKGLTQQEFNEFKVSGKVAADAKELNWKAYQTYSDSSVVEWVGAADAEYPASVTTVAAGTGEGDGHGHGAAAGTDPAASPAPADADHAAAPAEKESSLPLYLSIAALVLGAAAVIAAFARRGAKG